MKEYTEERQPWVTCFLTNILLSYVEQATGGKKRIDYSALFSAIEGFEVPTDPESFLKDPNNWVPLTVLRGLHSQCEAISGRKDFAYHAARAHFDPKKKQLPSLFEIIAHVLNDIRSLLVCADLWASVQTNYLRFQSFEGPKRDLFMLAQFDDNARPSVGTMHLLRGTCEGIIRLCPFIEDVECIEELSQLQIEDIVREFPAFEVTSEQNRLFIRRRSGQQVIAEAITVPLKTEMISLSEDFLAKKADAVVVLPHGGRISVLASSEEPDQRRKSQAPTGCKIVNAGVLSHDTLFYSFKHGQIYNAPYCRLRFTWKGRGRQRREPSLENVSRREVSRLLFDHLKQIKHTHMHMIQDSIERRRLTLENIRLRREIAQEYSFAGIVGNSEKMRELLGLVRSIAQTDVTVLIQGETGTGKELIARAIHYSSARSPKRFVAVNCGSFTETLLESELFGHEKGAFTGATNQRKGIFEFADGGTLFLDEIGEIAPSTQARLLRVLQEGEFQRVGSSTTIKVDVRIVAATNRNLEELTKMRHLRQDLFYRLNVMPIRVPTLRERAEDIPLLVRHFIGKVNRKMNTSVSGMDPEAMAFLVGYSWPGNVRELENVVQRMMVLTKSETLDVADLPPEIRGEEDSPEQKAKSLKGIARGSTEAVEKRAILDALAKTRGNITRAAQMLGVSRITLHKKIKTYNLRIFSK